MAFTGFPPEAIDFYERLAADNSREFWQTHRDDYVRYVRDPMIELTEALADYGPFHLFRPYNDLRFSKGRPPYKTQQGAYGESEGGAGYYVQISADGLMVGAGYYAMATDQLARFRTALDAEATGAECADLVADVERRGYTIGAISELKTAPRGVPREHPRIDLMRRKGLIAARERGVPAWLSSKRVVSEVRSMWDGAADLCAWLDRHVGPSTLPPDERAF
jgi:uncharacterized protein (TIGR02453 family)